VHSFELARWYNKYATDANGGVKEVAALAHLNRKTLYP